MLFVNVTTVVIIMAENKHERHIENCAGIRGFIYSFDTENLVNLKYEDDMLLSPILIVKNHHLQIHV